MGAGGDLGHDAPVRGMLGDLTRTTFDTDMAAALLVTDTTAAAVSSQVVSMPSTVFCTRGTPRSGATSRRGLLHGMS